MPPLIQMEYIPTPEDYIIALLKCLLLTLVVVKVVFFVIKKRQRLKI